MDLRELNLNIAQNRHPWKLSRAQFFRELLRRWVLPTDHVALGVAIGGVPFRSFWATLSFEICSTHILSLNALRR